MDLLRGHLKQVLQELPGGLSVSFCNEMRDSELGRAVDVDEEKELALRCLPLGDVDVKEPNWIALEFPLPGLVAFLVRQPGDVTSLQAPMQC